MDILHYIKTAFRSLLRNKLYSAINIAGLAIGLGLSIIILLLIKYELNYDTHIKDSGNIYRVTSIGESAKGEQAVRDALTPLPLSGLLNTLPQTDAVTRLIPGANKLIKYNTASLSKSRFFFADPTFFDVFDLRIIKGSIEKLNKPGSVAIAKSMAESYFRDNNPIGKKINRGGIDYEIIAVCEDMPEASHFHFDFIASISTIKKMFNYNKKILNEWENNWRLLTCYTYAKIKPGTDIRLFEEYLNKKIEQDEAAKLSESNKKNENTFFRFHLQPIQSIHLHSKLNSEIEPLSNPFRVIIFIAIAVFILIITSINFINITTSEPSKRLRDAVIRKTLGARRYHIAIQIFTEAFIISAAATLFGFVLAELMIPSFNKLFDLSLSIDQIQGLQDIGIVILTTFIIGVISGGYPAKFFSKISIVNIFGNRYKIHKNSFIIRGIIIAGHVFVVLFLLILTAGIWQQLNYISNKDLGFNKKNLFVIERAGTVKKDYENFKRDLKNINGVENVSASMSIPGEEYIEMPFTYQGIDNSRKTPITINYVDCDYLRTMELTLRRGSFLSCETGDSMGVILNTAAIKKFKIKKPLEEQLETGFNERKWNINIMGVVSDYNYEPLNNKIKPLGIMLLCKHNYFRYIIIRVDNRQNKKALAEIRNLWKKYSGDQPLDSFFLEDRLKNIYNQDSRMLTALIIFTLFSFFISILGFLSFASFLIEYKDKKISLMKITGIPDTYILTDLLGSFGKYVLIGISLAILPAMATVKIWLKNFAFTENISLITYIFLIVIVSAIGILSISYQYYKLVYKKSDHYLIKRRLYR